MWLSQQVIAAQNRKTAAQVAEVTGAAVMQGENEYRSIPLLGPWGIAYLPPNAAKTVVVGTGSGNACIGAVTEEKGIAPGELLLFSSGGASIYLKNSGEIVINGQVFAAQKGD